MKLEVKNVSKKFDKKTVLNNVNFVVKSGEVISLIGRNGSGKTTMMKLLVGIFNKGTGEIIVDGKSLWNNSNVMKKIIYVPDKFDYFKFTRLKNIMTYYKLIYPNFDSNYFLDELKANGISSKKRVSELSKGESLIFSIILGLACKTEFILLDEPLDGVDVININKVLNYITDAQEAGVGIVISSHRLTYVENISDKIVYLETNENISKELVKENYNKYQIVIKDDVMPKIFSDSRVKIISNLGRVYIAIVADDFDDFEQILNDSDEVQQYDKTQVTLEDIFIAKEERGK